MSIVKRSGPLLILLALLAGAQAGTFTITRLGTNGLLTWTNAFAPGICTVETAPQLPTATGHPNWTPQQNFFTTNTVGNGWCSNVSGPYFARLLAVDVSTNTPTAYTNLVQSYGLLHTIAGSGADAGKDNVNYWLPSFEGGYATNAALSRPHFAMEDDAGNVFVVDKNSHSVLKITLDGRIHTVAGNHSAGNGPDTWTAGTNVALNQPNGLWVRGDGTAYVLDTGNSKVRRLDTNGFLTTIFVDTKGISSGRGLWVRADEGLIYYCSQTDLRQWTPGGGTANLNKNFVNLGNITLSGPNLVATDRDDNKVWLVNTNSGSRTLLFGDGNTNAVVDGSLAATNSLNDVRGVWQPPIGGYFLATDAGAQLLYVDTRGIIHVFVNGSGDSHSGDGQWFFTPGYKFGQLRAVCMDKQGNLLIVENDLGFVRRIDFQRLSP